MTGRRRTAILAICSSSLFLVSLDGTIVNVALPSIARDLRASLSTLQWTVDAYLLVLAALLLLSGSVADRIGRRTVFAIGVGLFTTGSLLCGTAASDGWLVVFRMVQAAGGSAMTPVALAIVTNVFVRPVERAKAIGVWAAVSGVGMAAGPLLGGWLVDAVGWRSIFWINVPLGVIVVLLTLSVVPQSKSAAPRPFDPWGQLWAVGACVALVFSVIEAPRWGLSWPIMTGLMVMVAAFVALVVHERRQPLPLIPLELFGERSFVVAFTVGTGGFLAFGGLMFANTLYLQEVRALSATTAGLLTLPLAIMTVVSAPLSGRMLARTGPRPPLLLAGSALAIGALLVLVISTAGWPLWTLLVAYAVFGLGYGMLNAPVNDTAVSDLPDDRAGTAAALVSTAKQVGAALGVAIAGAVLAAGSGAALTEAFDSHGWIVWTVVAVAGVGIVVVAGRLPRSSSDGTHRDQDSVAASSR